MIKPGEVDARLDIRDVIERYGSVQFNPRGFARCPFHQEKTASFKIHGNRFYCFGCGARGGPIDFIMRTQNLTLPQAIVRLDSDYSLGLSWRKPTREERLRAKEEKRIDQALRAWTDQIEQNYLMAIDARQKLWKRLQETGDPELEDYINRMDSILDDTTGRRAWEEWQIMT